MTASTDNKKEQPKKVKKKSVIRTSAVIPIILIALALGAYAKFALNSHLRSLLTWSAEQVHGAEVNISSVRLSFLSGKLDINNIQVTNKDEPTKNLIQISKMAFHLNTYELLKAKFVIDHSELSGIMWDSPRKSAGEVFTQEERNSQALKKMEKATLQSAQENFKGNAIENVANILSGNSAKAEIDTIKDELTTQKKIVELENNIKKQEEYFENKIKELKKKHNLKEIEKQAKNYKWNKKNPIKSLSELNSIVKRTSRAYKAYKSELDKLEKEVKKVSKAGENIDNWIEEDMNDLQSKIGIPKLDPKELAFSLFGNYFGTNVGKYRKYAAMANEYMPAPKEDRKDDEIVPPKRSEGKTIHFPIKGEAPKLWIKKIKISSQAGKSEFGGNISGELTHLSSSPSIVNEPTRLKLKGDFPGQNINGINLNAMLDNRTKLSKQQLDIDVREFPFKEKEISKSEKAKVTLLSSPAKLNFSAKNQQSAVKVNLNVSMNNPNFSVNAQKPMVEESLKNIFNSLNILTIDAQAQGQWEKLSWDISTNIAKALSKGLTQEVGRRVAQAKKELRQKIEQKVAPYKEKLTSAKNKFDSEIKGKIKAQKNNANSELKGLLDKLKGQKKNSVEDKAKKLLKKIF